MTEERGVSGCRRLVRVLGTLLAALLLFSPGATTATAAAEPFRDIAVVAPVAGASPITLPNDESQAGRSTKARVFDSAAFRSDRERRSTRIASPSMGTTAAHGLRVMHGSLSSPGCCVAANTAARAHIDPGKFDYLFGKVTSGSHNLNRSLQNERQLASVGVFDNSAGRALISEHLDGVAADGSNILRQYTDEFGTFQIRESLFTGPNGFLKFESAWQVTDDGLRLTTVIPFGRG